MFTSQFFSSTGDSLVDALNAKDSCQALGDKVAKRKLSPVRARPLAQKSLKTIEVVPLRFAPKLFNPQEVRYTSDGSWSSSESSAPEDSSSEDGDDAVSTLLRCTSSLGSRLASSDETLRNASIYSAESSLSAISVAASDGSAESAPASIGMAVCKAPPTNEKEHQGDVPASPADSQVGAMESTLDAELNTHGVFELPDGHAFHGTRAAFHEKLWGTPEWRDICLKEMDPGEYLRMLRTHDPEQYRATLLVLDVVAFACE